MNEPIKAVTARLYALRRMEQHLNNAITAVDQSIVQNDETIKEMEKDNFGADDALREAKDRLESAARSIRPDIDITTLELLHIMSTHMDKIGNLTRNRKAK